MIKYKEYILWSFFVVFLGFSLPLAVFLTAGGVLANLENSSAVYIAPEFNVAKVFVPLTRSASVFSTLVFVGDIMMGRGVEKSVNENMDGDFSTLFENSHFIKEADIAFGNLEGPVADTGKDLGKLYSFRFKPDALDALIDVGFDALSVANNHSADWGREAFEENVFRLKNENVVVVGGGADMRDATRLKVIEKNGIAFAFLGFSDVGPDWFEVGKNKSGILIAGRDYFTQLIKKASKESDVLIVSMHFGEEYENDSNDRQKSLAHAAIDNGAKMVIGHHPHVVQEVEMYKDGVIVYSLGNFIFDQNFSEETMEGLALEILLEDDEIISIKRKMVKLNQFFQPYLKIE